MGHDVNDGLIIHRFEVFDSDVFFFKLILSVRVTEHEPQMNSPVHECSTHAVK